MHFGFLNTCIKLVMFICIIDIAVSWSIYLPFLLLISVYNIYVFSILILKRSFIEKSVVLAQEKEKRIKTLIIIITVCVVICYVCSSNQKAHCCITFPPPSTLTYFTYLFALLTTSLRNRPLQCESC